MKLAGVKVIELALFLPGPHLTMMMADHGADVIKVEPYEGGEPNRHIGPKEDGETVYFRNTHRGKRSLRLNLKHTEGREILMRLAERADVLVESFRPGVVDRLGVGYAQVSARAPQLVYCSISAFGQSGAYRDRPAHDLAVEALAGLVSVNLDQDDRPAMPAVPASDMGASLMALVGDPHGAAEAARHRPGRLPRHRDARLAPRVDRERTGSGLRGRAFAGDEGRSGPGAETPSTTCTRRRTASGSRSAPPSTSSPRTSSPRPGDRTSPPTRTSSPASRGR